MKSDYEMTESLLKRRDEYLKTGKKRTVLGLIPKTVIPLFCIFAVILCILALNGVFERDKINIDLVGANSNIFDSENVFIGNSTSEGDTETDPENKESSYSSALDSALDWEISQIQAELSRDEWIPVSDVLNAVREGSEGIDTNKGLWMIEPLTLTVPKRFVYGGAIFALVDPDATDYSSLGFDPDKSYISDTLSKVTLCETLVEESGKAVIRAVTGKFYNVIGLNGYITALYEGKFLLYRAEKPAQFTIGDNVYFAELSVYDSVEYGISNVVAVENDEYIAFYAADKLNGGQICDYGYDGNTTVPVYVVRSKIQTADENREAWICYKYPAAPEEYRLNINVYGKVEDTAQKITDYFRAYNRGDFIYNPYSLISASSNEGGSVSDDNHVYENASASAGENSENTNYETFIYNNKKYFLIEDYRIDSDAILLQSDYGLKILAGSDEKYFCTAFKIKGEKNIIAVFYGDSLHYFTQDNA